VAAGAFAGVWRACRGEDAAELPASWALVPFPCVKLWSQVRLLCAEQGMGIAACLIDRLCVFCGHELLTSTL
jgi:hypothetical protein